MRILFEVHENKNDIETSSGKCPPVTISKSFLGFTVIQNVTCYPSRDILNISVRIFNVFITTRETDLTVLKSFDNDFISIDLITYSYFSLFLDEMQLDTSTS